MGGTYRGALVAMLLAELLTVMFHCCEALDAFDVSFELVEGFILAANKRPFPDASA